MFKIKMPLRETQMVLWPFILQVFVRASLGIRFVVNHVEANEQYADKVDVYLEQEDVG